jgi:hypothetical protein
MESHCGFDNHFARSVVESCTKCDSFDLMYMLTNNEHIKSTTKFDMRDKLPLYATRLVRLVFECL